MPLTLNLTSEIEQYLSQKAREKGLSLEAYVLKLLKDTILEQEKQTKLYPITMNCPNFIERKSMKGNILFVGIHQLNYLYSNVIS